MKLYILKSITQWYKLWKLKYENAKHRKQMKMKILFTDQTYNVQSQLYIRWYGTLLSTSPIF